MPKAGKATSFAGARDAVLVLRGDAKKVANWVERGTVPAYVIDLDDGFAAVVPAGPGHASHPYDRAERLLAARPTPMTMRPTFAAFVEGDQAVAVVQSRKWGSQSRWCVIQQGTGPIRADLPQANLDDLLEAGPDGHREALTRVLAQVDASPMQMLRGVMAALGMPGSHLLGLAEVGGVVAELVEPDPKAVERFDKTVEAENEERAELEAASEEL